MEAQRKALQHIGEIPGLWDHTGPDEMVAIYALSSDLTYDQLQKDVGPSVRLVRPGGDIPLPSGQWFKPYDIKASCLDELPEIDNLEIETEAQPVDDHPLAEYSVRGHGDALAASAVTATPLLGLAVLIGQMTLIYGVPNAGKSLLVLSLLCEAVGAGRLAGENLFYVNADDSSQGAAEKVLLLDSVGAHTLLPGHKGFSIEKLEPLLLLVASEGRAAGCVIIVDTLKKAIDIMNKTDSTRFGKAVRAFVQAGGTFIALAHTNKHPGANGKLSYAGTADFHQDADACLYLQRIGETSSGEEVFVQFEVFKQRGPNRNETYAYRAGPDVTYRDRLRSVRFVGDDEMEVAARHALQAADAEVIAGIRESIEDGNVKKMDLEKSVRFALGVPRSRFSEVLDRYDGQFWAHQVRERGAKVFRLLD